MGINQREQTKMTDAEALAFLEAGRTATMATINADGLPHLVAMWYGVVDGKIVFETKVRSQKVANLRRNPSVSVLVETGETYDQLQGVAVEGEAVLLDESDERFWRAAISVMERYFGPYTDDQRPLAEKMMYKRLVVLVEPRRVRSWDHRKLGLPPQAYAGSTART